MTDHAAPSIEDVRAPSASWTQSAAPWAFGGAMVLSAALVFSLQPMFAKMVLPRVGGGAAVWTVALVFFQGALLAGYCYAHLLTSRLAFAQQVFTHAVVLLLAGVFLPISVASGFEAPPESGQGVWLMMLFAASVGAPFAAISATAPLLQAWFARSGRSDANDPYYLYGASNLGSLTALLAFPLMVEPFLGAVAQAATWSAGFALLGVAILVCAFLVARAGASERAAEHVSSAAVAASWLTRGKWALFGLLPSALLVAATTHISTDVASAPLLWVIPLALYLSAFILAFGKRAWISAQVSSIVLPVLAAAALVTAWSSGDWRLLSLAVLAMLWLGTYVCCRALYDIRPEARQLTDFYLWMSLGGVVGGAVTALVAPLVFDSVLEWPIAVALCLLALPGGKLPSRLMLIIFAVCVATTVAGGVMAGLGVVNARLISMGLVTGVTAIIIGRTSRTLMGVGAASIILLGVVTQHQGAAFVGRSFYGSVRVSDVGSWRLFVHGTTLHGTQSLDAAQVRTPTAYYGLRTPIGVAVQALDSAGRLNDVAVLGLGAGAMACYARPGQNWTFYEIDPLVVRVARDPNLFTFLSGCAPTAPVIVGDARLELAKQPAGAYDLVVADTFSSDAVPTHMITREAMQLYLNSIDEDGVILIHVSNRNLAMANVAARAGLAAGAVVIQRRYLPPQFSYANFGSEVVAMARSRAALAPLLADGHWQDSAPPPGRAWTDDYSNILEPFVDRLRHPVPASHP